MRAIVPRIRRIAGNRLDHALIVVGSVVMTLGSLMPWIKGSTRLNGNLNWTGLDDTGEGAMLLFAAVGLVLYVRLRGMLEEITPRARFIPAVVAIACGLLWGIAFQKALYLSWFEIEVGARPQVGMLVAAFGILLILCGGLLAATDPESVAAARASEERERRRSGAGGDGAASDRTRRGGGGSPSNPEGYSVVGRVERVSDRDDGGSGGGRDRG